MHKKFLTPFKTTYVTLGQCGLWIALLVGMVLGGTLGLPVSAQPYNADPERALIYRQLQSNPVYPNRFLDFDLTLSFEDRTRVHAPNTKYYAIAKTLGTMLEGISVATLVEQFLTHTGDWTGDNLNRHIILLSLACGWNLPFGWAMDQLKPCGNPCWVRGHSWGLWTGRLLRVAEIGFSLASCGVIASAIGTDSLEAVLPSLGLTCAGIGAGFLGTLFSLPACCLWQWGPCSRP